MKKILLLILISVLFELPVAGQNIPIYRQYYFNPSILNPAYNGINNYNELNLFYRKQWLNVQDAPESFGLNFQYPTKKRVFLALDVYSEEIVLVNTASVLATFGYIVPFSDVSRLRFALSGGVGMNRLNLSEDDLNTQDPVILNAMENNYYLDSRFGVVYEYDRFRIGFSLPRLFESSTFSDSQFNEILFSEMDYRIFSTSYTFNLNPNMRLDPHLVFIQNSSVNQLGGALGFNYKEVFWIGASYQNTVGGFVGLQIKESIRMQYNYEYNSLETSAFQSASHGIQLSLRIGKIKKMTKKEITPESQEPDLQEETAAIVVAEPIMQETIADNPPDSAPGEIEEATVIVIPPDIEPEHTVIDTTPEQDPIVESSLPKKIQIGYYVIIGVFDIKENAVNFMSQTENDGYDCEVFYLSANKRYYVHVFYDPEDQKKTKDTMGLFRDINGFKDAWLLQVE